MGEAGATRLAGAVLRTSLGLAGALLRTSLGLAARRSTARRTIAEKSTFPVLKLVASHCAACITGGTLARLHAGPALGSACAGSGFISSRARGVRDSAPTGSARRHAAGFDWGLGVASLRARAELSCRGGVWGACRPRGVGSCRRLVFPSRALLPLSGTLPGIFREHATAALHAELSWPATPSR